MKQIKQVITCLRAVMLITMVAAMTANAAAALNGRLVLRPLTPGEVTLYQLPASTATSPGLNTVGIGSPVYLEAEIDIAIPASDIISVNWLLATNPAFSSAFLTNSPLGTNVPVYGPGIVRCIKWPGASFCGQTSWANTRWSPPLSRAATGPRV